MLYSLLVPRLCAVRRVAQLPLLFAIDPGSHWDAHIDDPSVLTHLLGEGIQPLVAYSPASNGRPRNDSTSSSSSWQSETWL